MNTIPAVAPTAAPRNIRPLGPRRELMRTGAITEANISPAMAPNTALGTPIMSGTKLRGMCPVSGSTTVDTAHCSTHKPPNNGPCACCNEDSAQSFQIEHDDPSKVCPTLPCAGVKLRIASALGEVVERVIGSRFPTAP